ncbi:hypothetical protein TCAL_12639 [Tigriopus californicus]|uniref:Pecanex-like protein n=1 Tax=Tigriopus californicus TaxID=6832 RepID=A0A553PIG0_TIGCA|nr:pecanex-like protein 4 [Tigriopus californicus]TRY77474.1 hypothetical protein TCAL_12639 [Tigriopus californicus]|eukprot:TCALIF_12639-PA protein Name:"Similar to Pcnxl4 Pecanex-like protein 4 (Mus musculus)" AED:0.00 eAED:0.00 QI:0/-1/0/1/-1/1/1/0/1339
MSTDVPLLNDYKRTFVRNRLLQTFTGGLRLTGCPWYGVVGQIVLFIIPSVAISVFYIFRDWQHSGWGRAIAYVICGTAIFLYGIILQALAHFIEKRAEAARGNAVSEVVDPLGQTQSSRPKFDFMEDEDRVVLDGCCGLACWKFLIPKKKYRFNIFFHPLLGGLTTGLGLYFLRLGNVQDIFEGTHRSVLIIIFGWFAIVNALYGLLTNPPPEIATFRALEIYEIGCLSRPFHVLFLILPQIILDYLVENGPFGGIDRYWYGSEPWIGLNYVSHIMLAAMPLLWFLGLFPNVEAFIFWFGEQLEIFVLGGSASYNPLRFSIYLSLSVIQFGLFFAFGALEPGSIASLVTIAGVCGYILSLDLVGILDRLFLKLWRKSKVDTHLNSSQHRYHVSRSKTSRKHSNKVPFSKIAQTVKEFFIHLIFLTITIAILIWYPYQPYQQQSSEGEFLETGSPASNETKSGNGTTSQLRINRTFSVHVVVLGWICVGLYLFLKITNEIQKVYSLFGCVRSPCYSSQVDTLPNMVWICFRSLIIHFGSPILLSCYVKNLVLEDSILFLDPLPKWFEILALIRIMRWIWQNSEAALIEVGMLNLFLLINYPLAQQSGSVGFFVNELSRGVQLLAFGFLRDRIKQFVEKLYFVISLTVSSLEDRASKRSYAGCLFQLNILFFPVVLGFILISSLISAPLLASFTLPIFFIAFPRPIKFWPGPIGSQANCSEDSVYYQQMIPSLIPAVHRANRAGRLGVLHVGSYLIVRHEDRLVWIQVLEKGNNYFYYGAKGMELQETSCHSLEATRLDDIFLDTFEKQASMNRFMFHTVTPLVSLPVLMYSDTRNVLTGIIESQDTLGLICKTYLQTLVWYLFKWIIKAKHKKSCIVPMQITQSSEEIDTTADHVIQLAQLQDPDPISSDSVNEIDLDEWPSSESTTEQLQWAQTTTMGNPNLGPRISTPGSTIFDQMSDIVDGDYESGVEDVHGKSLPRNKLLPPINIGHSSATNVQRTDSLDSLSKKLDNIYLPGGVLEKTPQAQRREPLTKELTFASPKPDQRTFKTFMASRLAPDLHWLNLPEFFNTHEEILENNFSREWFVFAFKRTFKTFLENQGHHDTDQELEDLLVDEDLTDMYRKVIKDAFLTVYGPYSGRNANALAASGGPALPVNAFGSVFPTSVQLDWIRNETPAFLDQVIIPSIRSAFKLAMDQVLLGFFSSMEELEENLIELDEKWYLGLEDEPEWKKAVARQVPNLFSVSAVEAGGRTSRTLYRSHMLSLRECEVNVGRLNPEVVKGLWASLNLELLYLTNDDDERYSIQAEERLLRNLTVQVADPPLGYTIHSSAAIRQGIEPL